MSRTFGILRLPHSDVGQLLRLVASRLLLSAGTFLLVSVLIFAIVEILPGDAASRILGRDATPEMVAQLRERLGLNDPALVRYGRWLSNAVRGDLGTSLAGNRPVSEVVAPRLENTLILAAAAVALYLPLSFGVGVVTAMFHHRAPDNVLSTLALLGMSMPEFVIGTLLIVVFAASLGWLPALSMLTDGEPLSVAVKKLILPVLTLMAAMTAYGVRMLRDGLIEVFEAEFVRMATLRGLPRWRVIFRHALPSAILPMLNVTALSIAWLIGGVVVVETVFTFPGLGRLLINSIGDLDVPIIEAVVLIMAFAYVLVNLAVDAAAILLDPRLRVK
jgi:peptide/nickel transport system permease protein